MSPGTSLVTYDKTPPTEPSSITRSRGMPQFNMYLIHTAKSQIPISESLRNFTGLYKEAFSVYSILTLRSSLVLSVQYHSSSVGFIPP